VLPLTGLEPAGDVAALLLDRARSVQPELPGGPGTERLAAEICRMVDGLPLASELAAAHARTLPLAGIRDGMADRMAFLTGARWRSGLSRHDSLASSLDWSAELVGERARVALAALSVVDGRFPLEVAAAVTGGDRDVVETLVDHSLVQFDVVDGRYVLLAPPQRERGEQHPKWRWGTWRPCGSTRLRCWPAPVRPMSFMRDSWTGPQPSPMRSVAAWNGPTPTRCTGSGTRMRRC